VLHKFRGGVDGESPQKVTLVSDNARNFYGTTGSGGRTDRCSNEGCGTIFKLSPQAGAKWKETVLYRFDGYHGATPYSGLIFDGDGNPYGTTGGGGKNFGVVFKFTP